MIISSGYQDVPGVQLFVWSRPQAVQSQRVDVCLKLISKCQTPVQSKKLLPRVEQIWNIWNHLCCCLCPDWLFQQWSRGCQSWLGQLQPPELLQPSHLRQQQPVLLLNVYVFFPVIVLRLRRLRQVCSWGKARPLQCWWSLPRGRWRSCRWWPRGRWRSCRRWQRWCQGQWWDWW